MDALRPGVSLSVDAGPFGLFVVVARPCTYEFAFFVFKVSAGLKKGVRSAGNGHNGVKRVEAEHRP